MYYIFTHKLIDGEKFYVAFIIFMANYATPVTCVAAVGFDCLIGISLTLLSALLWPRKQSQTHVVGTGTSSLIEWEEFDIAFSTFMAKKAVKLKLLGLGLLH